MFDHFSKRALVLGAMLACGSSHAVHPGVLPANGPVINPFTNQETQVWKLVGNSTGCSAILISPEWTLSANHCRAGWVLPENPPTLHYYRNNHLSAAADPLTVGQTKNNRDTCERVPGRDYWLCRLQTPGTFPVPFAFPPLVAAPISSADSLANLQGLGSNIGSLMLYGRSPVAGRQSVDDPAPPLNYVAFRTFSGTPLGYSPITDPDSHTIAWIDAGDSGGAAFWFSPSGQPALIGTSVTPLHFFTEADITWIRDKITAYGDTPPATVFALTMSSTTFLASPNTIIVLSM
jgi:hypothetical protein